MEVMYGKGMDFGILRENVMMRHGCSKLGVIHGDGAGRVVVGDGDVRNGGGKRLTPQKWLDSSVRKRDEVNNTHSHSHSRGVQQQYCVLRLAVLIGVQINTREKL
jgi:hypothetical protein